MSRKSKKSKSSEKSHSEESSSQGAAKGTSGADLLVGTAKNDNIKAKGGDDTVDGGAGNDKLDGGDGNDSLSGGAGNDKLKGGKGQDTLDGGDGNDKLDGQQGDDVLSGGAGKDDLKGGDGQDTLDGGDGNDKLNGQDGDDVLSGGAGKDDLKGGDGQDTLNGGAGDDKMTGGAGDDNMLGGAGDDVMLGDGTGSFGGSGSGDHSVASFNDYLDGGAGNDWVQGDLGDDTVLGGAGNDVVIGDSFGSGSGFGKGSGKGSGSGSGDLWSASVQPNLGGSGSGKGSGSGDVSAATFNDYLDGGSGDDIVLGMQGNDEARYGVGENAGASDKYAGGSGIDTLTLDMTRDEWFRADIQQDIADYLVFLAANTNATTGEANSNEFQFQSFDLIAREFENLRVYVDGVEIDPTDHTPAAVDDTGDVNEDDASIAFGTVLANDDVQDLVQSITLVSGPAEGVLDFVEGTGGVQSGTGDLDQINGRTVGSFTFDPNDDFEDLAVGETRDVSFTYEVTDADGDTTQATVTITITGQNDAPIISVGDSVVSGGVTEHADLSAGENTTSHNASGQVSFSDVDVSDTHSASFVANGADYRGAFTIQSPTATNTTTDGQIGWSFDIADAAIDDLREGQVLTQSYDITVDDGNGGTDTTTVTVTITGTNDAPVIDSAAAIVDFTESVAPSAYSASGTIAFSDVDTLDSHVVTRGALNVTGTRPNGDPIPHDPQGITAADIALLESALVVNADGTWSFDVAATDQIERLSEGFTIELTSLITVTDDSGAAIDTDTQLLTITITGTNDAPEVLSSVTSGAVTEIVDLAAGETVDTLTTTGTVEFRDIDQANVHTVSVTDLGTGYRGGMSAEVTTETTGFGNQNNGVVDWQFDIADAAIDDLAAGQVLTQSYELTITDTDGGTTTETVTVTITGTNDAPIITSVAVNDELVEGDAPTALSTSGLITLTDVDALDSHVVTRGAATVAGTFNGVPLPYDAEGIRPEDISMVEAGLVVNTDGSWTFDLPASEMIDRMAQGQVYTITTEISVTDDSGAANDTDTQTLTITLIGTNDAPEITSAVTTGSLTEIADLAAGENATAHEASGLITFSDLDQADTHTVSVQANGTGYLGAMAAGVTTDTTNYGNQHAGEVNWTFNVDDSAIDDLAAGQSLTQSYTVTITDNNGTSDSEIVTVTITGTNDAPSVQGPLNSYANENDVDYTINLLDGASDVDNGAVFHAEDVSEANGNGGWSVNGDTLSINPDYFDDLRTGEFGQLSLNYKVVDENGAWVDQSVNVVIEGYTDAPSLEVVTQPGQAVNLVELLITSQPAADERVALTFDNLPTGAQVLNENGQDVTLGVDDYIGTQIFTVILPEGVDTKSELGVTVTGIEADGSILDAATQIVDLSLDISVDNSLLNFNSQNQSMWGDFGGQFGFHEFIPFLGDAPKAWNDVTQTWEATNGEHWRSGEMTLADVALTSQDIYDVALTGFQGALDVAHDAQAGAANILAAAESWRDAAWNKYNHVKDVAAGWTDYVVKEGLYQGAKVAYDVAAAAGSATQWAEDQALSSLHWNQSNYDSKVSASNHAHSVLLDSAWTVLGVTFYDPIKAADYAAKLAAQGVAWTGVGVAETAYDVAKAANAPAQAVVDLAGSALNDAGISRDAAYSLANNLEDAMQADGVYQDRDFQDGDAVTIAEEALALAESGAAETAVVAAVGVKLATDGAVEVAQVSFNSAETLVDTIQFDAALEVKADLFAQIGLQIDFDLDLGSVDTNLDYQLSSEFAYNKTTDILKITPTMTALTTGDTVAFSTISPNAQFYSSIVYDVGADISLFADGKLVVAGDAVFDMSPNSNGLIKNSTISTSAWSDTDPSIFPEGQLNVGEFVLVDFDSTSVEPFNVPFIERLTEDILSIQLALPTVEAQGTADTYNIDNFSEGGLLGVDLTEITSALMNVVNARLDYSPEFQALYGTGSLGNAKDASDIVNSMVTALAHVIVDSLDGNLETPPVFVIDTTDETNTSLFHVNTIGDDLSTFDADTASLGFFTAYGESDPVVKVNIDIDAAVAVIVNKIIEAAASGASYGTLTGFLAALPDFNPLDLQFGLEDLMKAVAVPQTVTDIVDNFVSLNMRFEAADLDTYATANFSQEFSLSVDDMAFRLALEDGTSMQLDAHSLNSVELANASDYDVNGDGIIGYDLSIVPQAMFSNDTEIGLSLGYTLDFLKTELGAGVQFSLAEILGVPDPLDQWPAILLPLVDFQTGPLLRLTGDLDVLDVDVFEDRFAFDVGSAAVQGGVSNIDDYVLGTVGADTLNGHEGNDVMIGDAGDDVFVFSLGTGIDTITDFQAGAGSDDTIDLSGFATFAAFADVEAAAFQDGDNTVIELAMGDQIVLDNIFMDDLHADDFIL